jgi:phosphoglycerate dehydrogenase-like enzyme
MDKVVSLAPLPAVIFRELFKMHGVDDIEVIDASAFDAAQIVEAVSDADYIIGDYRHHCQISREVVQAARKVKLIQQPSVGYEIIDVDACRELGIKVANTAGANTVAVAEQTIMTAMCLLKNLICAARTTAAGEWRQLDIRAAELSGRIWGIVGLGRIGRAVAERLVSFGVRTVYYDPLRPDAEGEERYRVTYAELDDVLKQSDILSLHCPLTSVTKGMIDRQKIALMKTGAMIVNTARGGVIEEEALAEALSEGRLSGAALDVFAAEPITPDNPLLRLAGDKVILSPHIAGVTQEAQGRIITMTISNIVRVIQGQPPENLVL